MVRLDDMHLQVNVIYWRTENDDFQRSTCIACSEYPSAQIISAKPGLGTG
jgi:hypothetical protein